MNSSINSRSADYQRCLLPKIHGDLQHTLHDVSNFVITPLDMLFAFLSFISNFLVLIAVLQTRSLQHPSLLLLCSLSITDLLWAIFSIVKDIERVTHEDFCPGKPPAVSRSVSQSVSRLLS